MDTGDRQGSMIRARRIAPAFSALFLVFLLLALLLLVSCAESGGGTTSSGAVTTSAGQTSTSQPETTTEGAETSSTQTTAGGTGSEAGSDSAPSPAIDVAKEVLPAVVAVVAADAQGQSLGLGSGVIYKSEGVIVTNNHVVVAGGDQPAPQLTVRLATGESLDATLVGRDVITDLAVLRVERNDLPAAQFLEDFSTVEVGQYAIAIGSPLGLVGSVTLGVVSAINRELGAEGSLGAVDLIQTDAPISPGNSGGALVDQQGRVIGINVAAIPPDAQTRAQNIGFAIPSDLVIDVVDQILEQGSVSYGYLGIQSSPITSEIQEQYQLSRSKGVLVLDVQPGSPAEQAGLQPGDIIVSINGQEVAGQTDLYSVLRGRDPGDQVELTIVRDGKEQTVSVTLGERPTGQ